MANTFKNSITGSIGTSPVTVYTVPGSTVSTIIGINVANVILSNIQVNVLITDASTTNTAHLAKNTQIIPGSAVVLVGGEQKVVLEAGDTITVTSSAAGSADVILSVLEIS